MRILSVVRTNWKWGLSVVAVLGVVCIVGVAGAIRSDRGAEASRSVFEVQRGPLTISVSVSGTIKAMDQEVIKSEVEGQTTILYIIPEGRRVQAGELLVELDASRLQDQLVDQEIATQNAEAAFINARETFEVVKNQAESDIDKAELAYRFAKEDRQKFLNGDFPLQAKEAEARVTLARGDMKRAQEKVEGSRRLAEGKFITSMELEADEQAAVKAQLDLQMSEEEAKLLHEFEYKRQLAQLESDEDQARMALERVKRKAAADIVQAEADLKARQLGAEREKGKLEKLKQQIAKTKLYAPREGLVVYATTGRGGFRGNEQPLAEGQNVFERQELIYLPTTDSYKAEVKVHESSLAKIRPGLAARLAADALPGRAFEGRVTSIAPLPDAQSMWMNPDLKVYNTSIEITSDADGLRTGMSCRGEILVEEFSDTLYVPVQAVVREGGEPTVYVVNGQKVDRRTVALGLDNNRMVQIKEGLNAGELVMLTPPLASDEMQARMEGQRTNGAPSATPAEPTAAPSEAPARGRRGGRTSSENMPEDVPRVEVSPPGGRDGADQPPSDAEREDARARYRNASPEERERMRQEFQQRMQNMTPEEREQMRQRRQRSRDGASREGGPQEGLRQAE